MRFTKEFLVEDITLFKKKILGWAEQYNEVLWLDSNNYTQQYSSFDGLLAVDAFTSIKTDFYDGFEKLKEYQSVTKDWLFGYLSYELKNDAEDLYSFNKDRLFFPDMYFFQPKKLFIIKGNKIYFHYLNMVSDEMMEDFENINNNVYTITADENTSDKLIRVEKRLHRDSYIEKVDTILSHIQRGDIYEVNFCQEFYAEKTTITPLTTFHKLNNISKTPFATYFKLNDLFLLSASPERYIRKQESKVISQPIKGTAKRAKDVKTDNFLRENLKKDSKERSENIMIVDLVRNDLSKTAKKGSVRVAELCEVYTFEQVHQMISTITSEVAETTHPVDMLKHTFPMGSMTGAPKISAMKVIEEQEITKRGLYSGAVGYFTPEGDFDFNVVIRSILYNETEQYISFSVGSAITAKSIPEKEYEECLIKAEAMRKVLEGIF
ncbi:anthranilate synthase component I family protein [Leptobacterium sp. I13]|uniref:anthranilate synthase component I family protein n=1 Tax=Leptobacterium meishanense TaxID=3128904 RepID=UPI0030EE6772